MPRKSPFCIVLKERDKKQLESMARKYTSAYYRVVRAKIVLLAAGGMENDEIGRRLDVPRQVVSKWRKRYFERGIEGLEDEPRKGRPPLFFSSGGRPGKSPCL